MTRSAACPRDAIACLVLAAGGSSRLGRPKQLVRFHGRPLIVRAVDAATGALPSARIVVVLGAHSLRLRCVLQRHAPRSRIVVNAHWQDGLASSLRAGVRALPREARAVLVLLVDQPWVDADAMRRLVRAWQRAPHVPAAAYYSGRAGVPAILPRRMWISLGKLTGDNGARELLRAASSLQLVPMVEAELDLDRPQDLMRLSYSPGRQSVSHS